MTYIPHGQHLIAGKRVATEKKFFSEPTHGEAHEFFEGTVELINEACAAGEEAFWSYGYTTREKRAEFLDAIADEIEARAEVITLIAAQETGLPEARIQGERGRTTGQLRLFASHIRNGDYLDRRIDATMPDRKPAPRPEIRMIQRPIGPVAVFGASNFPLAFSTAGGDTAAALAAGCPVIVKGHPAHPGTGEIAAEAIMAAATSCEIHPGVFSMIQGGSHEIGEALVTNPLIMAVGFTGSLRGGRALYDLCARRPEPIPFFGELGSVNPLFVLPAALSARGADMGKDWASSLTMGVGQFCTNPGIAVVPVGPAGDEFVAAASETLAAVPPQNMLTNGIAKAYHDGKKRFDTGSPNVKPVFTTESSGREALPNLYEVFSTVFLKDHTLGEEVFGPIGLVVRTTSIDDILEFARNIDGQLTATILMDDPDTETGKKLLPVLERKAGRVIINNFPTGVEVVDSMIHGGPYPASTNFGATSVGTLSIRRFLRPVAFQNLPADFLEGDLNFDR